MSLSEEGDFVRRVFLGESFVGREPDFRLLSAEDLGELSALAWSPTYVGSPLRFALLEAIRTREPVFDDRTAQAALSSLVEHAQTALEDEPSGVEGWMLEAAGQIVFGFSGSQWDALVESLRDLLARPLLCSPTPLLAVLAASAGLERPSLGDESADAEADFISGLESRQDRIIGARAASGWVFAMDDDELTPRGADPMALLPGYLAFAEGVVAAARKRVTAIQSGEIGYQADKAFSIEGAQVVRRALLAGLDQGCSWAESSAIPLFAGVSRAPDEKVKSVPSQSATVAFAKAIAERPSLHLISELKTELEKVRHAGMKKKVARFFQAAERRVIEHGDFFLSYDSEKPLPKTLLPSLARALEQLWFQNEPLPFELWQRQFLQSKSLAPLTTTLIWQFEDRGSLMVKKAGRAWEFTDSSGVATPQPTGAVMLWHPLAAEQPDAWRRRIVQDEISQPLNQAFREIYGPDAIDALLGPSLDIRSLLGLALSQSWRLSHEVRLVRAFGPIRVVLDVGRVFPGAAGATQCDSVRFFQAHSGDELEPKAVPQLSLSESLRAVDLLVSVAAFALDPVQAPFGGTAQARREALSAMLASNPSATARVEGRYVVHGETKIHIATGRASRDGVELEPAASAGAVRVLPYPDQTLGRIVAWLASGAHRRDVENKY